MQYFNPKARFLFLAQMQYPFNGLNFPFSPFCLPGHPKSFTEQGCRMTPRNTQPQQQSLFILFLYDCFIFMRIIWLMLSAENQRKIELDVR